MKAKHAVGDRVRVAIYLDPVKPKAWAQGSIACLDGKTGTVTAIVPEGGIDRERCLVTFDTPAESWWAHGSPSRAFHFEHEDLAPESSG